MLTVVMVSCLCVPGSLRENIVLPTIRFGHLDFDHLILFQVSSRGPAGFGFRISDSSGLRFQHNVGVHGQGDAFRYHERIDIDLLDLRTGDAQLTEAYQNIGHCVFVKGPLPSKTV
jgi:hypothetical protein